MNYLLLGLSIGYIVCGLALPALGAVSNGDVISISASCEYTTGLYVDPLWSSSAVDLALASRLCTRVYMPQCWKRSRGPAAGMMVRALVRKDGEVVLADGVQLLDGRVMVDGQMLDRVDPPEPRPRLVHPSNRVR